MYYAYKYRLKPSDDHREELDRHRDICRQLYNHCLYRFDEYRENHGKLRNCRRESLVLECGDESPSLFTFTVRYSLRCSPCVFLGIRRGTSAPISGQSDKFGLPDRGSKYPFGIGWVPTLNNQVPPNPVPLSDGIGVTATWHGQHLVGV
ncbi:helix-turn-helix domain-containing protein [Haladaptatus halobius]|uniref:helix-turn-helix domain-containing protein n=1 Tax=Haladaptatus halobius TaxID=2884875 RepID=UPI003F5EDFD6